MPVSAADVPESHTPAGSPWSAAPVEIAPPVGREPAFKAPGVVLALLVVLVAGYALQRALGSDPIIERFGFSPADLSRGRWSGLLSALFLHGSWAHVLMNAFGALAFGAPVARLFGTGGRGGLAFAGFYLVCGVASCLGYAVLHPGSLNVLIGASGAISGLMGAASRLLERRDGGLAPFRSATVIGMAVAWVVVNGLIALVGFGPGTAGQPVAWEAHLFGYAAGLLLVGPAAALLAPRARPNA